MYVKEASNYITLISDSIKKQAEVVAELLTPQSKVIVCGLGKSYHSAVLGCSIAQSFSLRWYPLHAGSALHGDVGIVGPRDIVLFVSNSGKTEEIVRVAEHLKGHKRIAVIGRSSSPLERICEKTVFLPVEFEYSPFGLAPMTSSVLQVMFLNQIVCEIVEGHHLPFEVYSNSHPSGTIGELARDM